MILGYKQHFPWGAETNFKRKIIDGTKKHSIRKDPKNRWSVGMKIQQAIYRFRMQYHKFADHECKSIQHIEIELVEKTTPNAYTLYFKKNDTRYFTVKIDGRLLEYWEILILSENDGFDVSQIFFRMFSNGFSGKIIHFTDFKY